MERFAASDGRAAPEAGCAHVGGASQWNYTADVVHYADVVLPVPLNQSFTYTLNGAEATAGVRVLVPFAGQRLVGIVVRVHDQPPPGTVKCKPIYQLLDKRPLLDSGLIRLGRWLSEYYFAPLGEVLRAMLPLQAEVRRTVLYRITEAGRLILHQGADRGSSHRSRLSAEDQRREYAVLNVLEGGDGLTAVKLRSTGSNKAMLEAMVRKRWLQRDLHATSRTSRRTQTVAVLAVVDGPQRLNGNQSTLLDALRDAGGRMPLRSLRKLPLPHTTVMTLVRRGLVRLEEQPDPYRAAAIVSQAGEKRHEHQLNDAQCRALGVIAEALHSNAFVPMLLYGVTGSGKTAVYFAAMQRALAAGKTALLLVPEIGLTPAIAEQMYTVFGAEVAVLHSQLTPDERAEQWHRIQGGDARVVLGTRSAVFAPLPKLGLIVVDEEHDNSYKQEEAPRYHGRDVAVMRAKQLGIPIVLGSATPSLESWSNVQGKRYGLLRLPKRVAGRSLPQVEVVDMRAEFRAVGAEHLFSRRLVEEVQATLERNQQAIILLNRRGYSQIILCRSCGEKVICENCSLAMTLHRGDLNPGSHSSAAEHLQCHHCGFRQAVPGLCPHCGSEHLYALGAGSQQGEERLQEVFPSARIGRMDRDTVRGRADMERLLRQLHTGEINLLVGTQMIAKGHDIHGVTTVGVVGCDYVLGMPDFRAAERVFQIVAQVSGRAGRGQEPGRVLVQSFHPEHYAVRYAATAHFEEFARRELQFRQPFLYPPHGVLANVLVRSTEREEAETWSASLGEWFRQAGPKDVYLLGPAAAPVTRLKRVYRYHLLLKARQRSQLQHALRGLLQAAATRNIPPTAVSVDVDAVSLM